MSSIGSVAPVPAAGSADTGSGRRSSGQGAPGTGTAASPAPAGGNSSSPTAAQVKAAVDAANRELDQSNHELTFVFDDKLGRMLVKIVDTRTNTVIRQVPSEDMLAAARALAGSPTRGALLKSKA
jgi:flagellar protein FlaG